MTTGLAAHLLSSNPSSTMSEDYLRRCQQPTSNDDEDISSRKLLVLDLNGTLVHRVANASSSSASTSTASTSTSNLLPSAPSSASTTTTFDSSMSTIHPSIPKSTRTSHPRPYIPTLLSYLFHPETQDWLTTIAWSSSKPSSVAEMIERCFGFAHPDGHETLGRQRSKKGKKRVHAGDLAAIWTREEVIEEIQSEEGVRQVKKKKKAVKDLGRIWGWKGSDQMPDSQLPLPSCSSSSLTSQTLSGFSQMNTILLDDTPSKATHQPFNYIPIAKYTKERLLLDYASCGKTLVDDGDAEAETSGDSPIPTEPSSPAPPPKSALPGEERTQDVAGPSSTPLPGPALSAPSATAPPPTISIIPPHPAIPAASTAIGDDEPDPSLLAVIGILSALRHVQNVSWWIKHGGLYAHEDLQKAQEEEGLPWYAIPVVLNDWIEQGKKEVERLALDLTVYEDGEELEGTDEDIPSTSRSTSWCPPAVDASPAPTTSARKPLDNSSALPAVSSRSHPQLTRSPSSSGSAATIRASTPTAAISTTSGAKTVTVPVG